MMTTRLWVVFVLMLFSGVAFGASSNPNVEKRLAILETKFDALGKQIEANRQSTLKLIEVTNEATNKRFDALGKQIEANHQSTLKLIEVTNEATNKRIDTLNNWGIALFAGILAWIGVFITHALGFWDISKRDKTVTTTTEADGPEAGPVMQSVDA